MATTGHTGVRFSVIVPVYNRAGMIGRALDSILRQTYPAHEIVVVDDGSTDALDEALRPYSEQILYIHQAHAGPGVARNRGVGASSGEWVAFLDADDWYYPHRLLCCAQWIAREPALECIFGACDILRPDGSLIHVNTEASEAGGHVIARAAGARAIKLDYDDLADFGYDGFGNCNTFSVRRETFLALGGFPTNLFLGEDTFLWMKAVAFCGEIGVLLRPTACYVRYSDSTFKPSTLSSNQRYVQSRVVMLKASRSYPAPLRAGIRRRLQESRRHLGYAYIRAGQRRRAVQAVLPSLWENPGLAALKDVISMVRG